MNFTNDYHEWLSEVSISFEKELSKLLLCSLAKAIELAIMKLVRQLFPKELKPSKTANLSLLVTRV